MPFPTNPLRLFILNAGWAISADLSSVCPHVGPVMLFSTGSSTGGTSVEQSPPSDVRSPTQCHKTGPELRRCVRVRVSILAACLRPYRPESRPVAHSTANLVALVALPKEVVTVM